MAGRADQKAPQKMLPGGVDPALVVIAFVVAIGFSIIQWYMKKSDDKGDREKALEKISSKKKASSPAEGHEKLASHTGEFNKKEILTVQGNVHVAIGYGLANCILIEGK